MNEKPKLHDFHTVTSGEKIRSEEELRKDLEALRKTSSYRKGIREEDAIFGAGKDKDPMDVVRNTPVSTEASKALEALKRKPISTKPPNPFEVLSAIAEGEAATNELGKPEVIEGLLKTLKETPPPSKK